MMTSTSAAPVASEAVRALTQLTLSRAQETMNNLAALALRDAGLDPRDGWVYDVSDCSYRKGNT